MSKDFNPSLLIKQQLPDFIREEYPKFILFLEAYYEFLNNTQLEKGLHTFSDVDRTIDQFEEQFFNSFLPFFPRNVAVNKEFLIKKVLPLYLEKGSEKSYKLLFKLLFGEDVHVTYPGDNILRASDGRWTSENILKLTTTVFSEYTSDGNRTLFYLPEVYEPEEVLVYVNDALITTGYYILKEYQKLVFDVAPTINSNIKIYFTNFNKNLLNNRKITGRRSGAYALVESSSIRTYNRVRFFEFFINVKTYFGSFLNNEIMDSDVIFKDIVIPVSLKTYSDLETITIVDGGSGYNVGDPLLIQGQAERSAVAIVDSVASGLIQDVRVVKKGRGFQVGANVSATGYDSNVFFAQVISTDSSAAAGPNTVSFNSDIISNFASVSLNAATYGFPANSSANIVSVISTALSSNTINVGGIANVQIVTSLLSSGLIQTFDVESPAVGSLGTRLKDLGIIAKINIVFGGTGYALGDVIKFNSKDFAGYGANAVVSKVSSGGAITGVNLISGGYLYRNDSLPILTVSSANGQNAILQVDTIFGDGEIIAPAINTGLPGEIRRVRILDSGQGYTNTPGIIMTGSGNKDAILEASLRSSVVKLPGRWTTSDSLISSDERVLQGRDYYIDYSYLLTSKVEFSEYKTVLKNLLHPAGLVQYARYYNENELNYRITPTVESSVTII